MASIRKQSELMSSKELASAIRKMRSISFENEHGENFIIYSDGLSVYMEGDEVNAMVDPKYTVDGILPLFGSHFNIWSRDELYALGCAISELTEGDK